MGTRAEGGMKKECPGGPQSTGAAYRLGRFLKGLHPRQAGVEVRHLGLGRPAASAVGGLATSVVE